MKEISLLLLNEITEHIKDIDDLSLIQFADKILTAKRIFVIGEGTSDPIARFFAMRLSFLDLNVHYAKDVTVPAILKGDVLVIFSNYPESKYLLNVAKKAYISESDICVVYYGKNSKIADFASSGISIPQIPLKGVFDIKKAELLYGECSMIISDTIITYISSKVKASPESLLKRRPNLL